MTSRHSTTSKVPIIANFDSVTRPSYDVNEPTSTSSSGGGNNSSTSIYLDILQKHYSPIKAPYVASSSPDSTTSGKMVKKSPRQSARSSQQHDRGPLSDGNFTKETLHSVSNIVNKMKQSDQQMERKKMAQQRTKSISDTKPLISPRGISVTRTTDRSSNVKAQRRSPSSLSDRVYPATHRGDVPVRYQQMKNATTQVPSNDAWDKRSVTSNTSSKKLFDSQSVQEETVRLKQELKNLDTELEERFQIPKSKSSPLSKNSVENRSSHGYDIDSSDDEETDLKLLRASIANRNERLNNLLYRNKERSEMTNQELKEVEERSVHSPPETNPNSPRADTKSLYAVQYLKRPSPAKDSKTGVFTKLAEVRLLREQRKGDLVQRVEEDPNVPFVNPTKIDERLQIYRSMKKKQQQLQNQQNVGEIESNYELERDEQQPTIQPEVNNIPPKKDSYENERKDENSSISTSNPITQPPSTSGSSKSNTPSKITAQQDDNISEREYREPKKFLEQLLQIDAEITSELKRQNARLTEELELVSESYSKLRREHDALRKKYDKLQTEHSQLQKRLIDVERENDRSKNQISILEKEIEKLDSEPVLTFSDRKITGEKFGLDVAPLTGDMDIRVNMTKQGQIFVSFGDSNKQNLDEYMHLLTLEQ